MSHISVMHYLKLIFRSCLFVAATVVYVINRMKGTGGFFGGYTHLSYVMLLVWMVFVLEMILRFFPSKLESMGCQKQFRRNYKPTGETVCRPWFDKTVALVAILWVVLNGVIGALYNIGLIDAGILVLISLAFSVCDMICILFFCPFQTWIMKNKCCTNCRIYNWDYAMMFTPLAFSRNFLALSIFFCALLLLVRWELTAFLHTERFLEKTNACLSCDACQEKLCHHKKQLQQFLKKQHL